MCGTAWSRRGHQAGVGWVLGEEWFHKWPRLPPPHPTPAPGPAQTDHQTIHLEPIINLDMMPTATLLNKQCHQTYSILQFWYCSIYFRKTQKKGATHWPKISPVQEEIYKTGALWKIQANCYPNYKSWIHLIFTIPRRQYTGHYIFFLSRCFFNKIMYNTELRSCYKQIHQTFLQYSK